MPENHNLTIGTLSLGLVISIVLFSTSLDRLLNLFPFALSLEVFMVSFVALVVLTVLLALFIVRNWSFSGKPRRRR
ncbi:MAG: hypothetical protein KGH59_00260 [Candidatus Micrarchaeota archaeon]|nr:hypothetical protein [Candidatus Micrarchaeota archaeon]MDE1804206.1 hypothetical protein [Candidatus Micrarchaeota archaeon]MDE1846662.1 hypothetical protein [Candidatus Micrarchaeota archaeon]